MNKAMYSLILTDEVVDKIDRLAYEQGISRSQMIDHILAREVGLSTPEQQTRLIVRRTANRVSAVMPSLKLQIRSDLGSMEIATYVKYKYNPSIKYSFDIVTEKGEPMGCLRLSSRSTSLELQEHLDRFLAFLEAIDQAGAKLFRQDLTAGRQSRFQRDILLPKLFEGTRDPEVIGDRLSGCIALIEAAMQCYFNRLVSPTLMQDLAVVYEQYADLSQ
ncbi:MAG: hypothetical protein IJM90_02100 [Firmicutes bacterium]|nr:hypothetical protein [Bacillota bacterium]